MDKKDCEEFGCDLDRNVMKFVTKQWPGIPGEGPDMIYRCKHCGQLWNNFSSNKWIRVDEWE